MDLVIFGFVDMLRFSGNSGLGLGFGNSRFRIRIRIWRLRYFGHMKDHVPTATSSIDNQREEVSKEDVEKERALYCHNVSFLFLFLPTKLYICGLSLDIYGVTSLDMWCMLQGPIQLYRHLKSDLGQSRQIAPMYAHPQSKVPLNPKRISVRSPQVATS